MKQNNKSAAKTARATEAQLDKSAGPSYAERVEKGISILALELGAEGVPRGEVRARLRFMAEKGISRPEELEDFLKAAKILGVDLLGCGPEKVEGVISLCGQWEKARAVKAAKLAAKQAELDAAEEARMTPIERQKRALESVARRFELDLNDEVQFREAEDIVYAEHHERLRQKEAARQAALPVAKRNVTHSLGDALKAAVAKNQQKAA